MPCQTLRDLRMKKKNKNKKKTKKKKKKLQKTTTLITHLKQMKIKVL